MNTKIISVNFDSRSYEIYIGSGLLHRLQDFIPYSLSGVSTYIVADKNLETYAAQVKSMILSETGASQCEIIAIAGGEKVKSFKQMESLCSKLLERGIGRDSVIFALGGGSIGDLVGFCASILLRGVRMIQIPTTLLAQVDSSVGGKTAINTSHGKNLIGTFYQPSAVIADTQTLATLPKREILAGYAEIVKYGLIADYAFYCWLESNGQRVIDLSPDELIFAIEKSCKTKAEIVESDETEQGRRALLNLGHTFGHALEKEAGFNGTLLHGEAVAIGTVMAYDLSFRLGLCSQEDSERVENHFLTMGLHTRASMVGGLKTSIDRLIEAMKHDKKMKNGKMHFILANTLGSTLIKDDVPEDIVRDVLYESLGGETKTAKGQWTSAFSSLSSA